MLYLDEAPQNAAWFFKKMAMHESGTSSMDASAEMLQFNPYNSSLESLHTNWNHSSRCPNFSTIGDGGIGIFQLTDPKPHTQALWDWKCNVYGAYKLLTGNKQKILNQFEDFVWEHPTTPTLDHMVTKWDKENMDNKVVKLSETYASYTWKFGASPLFGNGFTKINNYFTESLANGEKSILDSWLTKLYNCYGCTAFLTATQASLTSKPIWQFNWNNYTNEVFNQQVPIYK